MLLSVLLLWKETRSTLFLTSEWWPPLASSFPLLPTSNTIILFLIIFFSQDGSNAVLFFFSHLFSLPFLADREKNCLWRFPAVVLFFRNSSIRIVQILRFTGQTLKTSVLSDYDLPCFRESSYPSVIGVNHLLDILNKTNLIMHGTLWPSWHCQYFTLSVTNQYFPLVFILFLTHLQNDFFFSLTLTSGFLLQCALDFWNLIFLYSF